MTAVGTQLPELLDEHRDGTIYVDIEGDLWTPHPWGGWVVVRRRPFAIGEQFVGEGDVSYGPFLAVLGPPTPKERP